MTLLQKFLLNGIYGAAARFFSDVKSSHEDGAIRTREQRSRKEGVFLFTRFKKEQKHLINSDRFEYNHVCFYSF